MTAPQATDPGAWLDRLEETWKAATPGPWFDIKRSDSSLTTCRVSTDPTAEDNDRIVAVTHGMENAAAIVAEHNATPALIAAVRAVLALADAIEEDWEAAYAAYEDDDTASLIRSAVTAALGATGGAR